MTDTSLILIVDDNLLLQRAAVRVLSHAGYRTCTADDGQTALRLARSERPDLILLDVVLSDISGLEVCRQIKADPALVGCFVVLLSSMAVDSPSQIEGLEGGADGYIARPIPNDELLARVRGLLRIKHAEDRLRASEERYRTLIEQASDGIFVADASGKFIDVNSTGCALLGYAHEEILQRSMQDLVPPDELLVTSFKMTDLQAGQVVVNERHLLRKDGSRLPVEISAKLLPDGRWQGIVRDITERKQAEARLLKLNRTYALLSDVNQAIGRVREPQELFEAACRIAVEQGGFRMAWIGLLDPQTKQVKPIAHAGEIDDYLEKLNITLDDSEHGRGPTAIALRTGTHVVVDDIEGDPRMSLWRADALRLGYRSSAAFPLILAGEVRGTFNLYVPEPSFFDDDELKLLDELAADIAFALEFTEQEQQRKRVEEALRESEARLRQMTSSMREALWLRDTQTLEVLYVNPAYEELWGRTCESLYQDPRSFLEAVHPEDKERVMQAIQKQYQGIFFNQEYRIIRPDGSVRWIWGRTFPIRDEAGQLIRVTAIAEDITERKQTEAALWKSEKRFRTLFEQAAVGVSLLETKTGRYVDINQRYCDFLGYTMEEMLDSKLQAVTHPDDVQTNLDNNVLLMAGKIREFSIEKRYLRKDGTVVWGNLTVSPLWAAGEEPDTYFHIAVVQDITERKRAEEALRELNATLEQRVADRTRRLYEANAQLSELDQLKDQFISRISHELRTPLANIISYLDLLENGKPEKRARYLQVLHEQAALLRELIESLLEVTQKSVNAAGVHVAPTDLNQLAASLIAEATPRAAQRGLTLASALTPELPFVSADGRLLAQALSKLVTNALNYTPTGGTIDVATAEVIDAGATWITFTIRDSGPGIAPDELAHIFDRFYRGRAAADYKTPGAGVGLSISRDILTSLDGRLTVQSDGVPGHGAAFTAWLKPA